MAYPSNFRRPRFAPPASPLVNRIPASTPQLPPNTFGPGNDLRSTQISPVASQRLTGARGMTGQAATGVQSFDRNASVQKYGQQFGQQLAIPSVGFRPVGTAASQRSVNPNVGARDVNTQVGMRSAPTSVAFQGVNPNVQARGPVNPATSQRFDTLSGQQDSAVSSLTTGPNRTALARNTLADFNENSALARTQGIRDIGKAAAKFGRIGAGMTTNDLTGLEGTLDRQRRQQENQLAASVAEGDINDRFRTVSTMSGLRDQEDSFGRMDRGELRGERDYATGVDERNYGRSANERDTALGLSERNIGRERQDRDIALGLDERNTGRELDDRAFRTGLDERNIGRDYSMAQDETALQERNIGRGINERDTELGLSERNVGRDFDSRRAALEAAIGMGDREAGDAGDRYRVASDFERGIAGQEAGERDELRGERTMQEELARYALENKIRQREMEERAQQGEFQRGYDRSRLGMAGSDQAADGANGAYDLLADYMRRRQGGAPTDAGTRSDGWSPESMVPSITPYNPAAVRPRITVKAKGGRGF